MIRQDFGDKLCELLGDAGLRETMGKAGRGASRGGSCLASSGATVGRFTSWL